MYDNEFDIVSDRDPYFRFVWGRRLNAMSTVYMLPADQEEVRRAELHHRLVQFLFRGRNYVGPVREALQFGRQRRSSESLYVLDRAWLGEQADSLKVLDLGTGDGHWAISMADEFPRAEVVGIDLAPLQPSHVPELCSFELWDLSDGIIPYPDSHFDLDNAHYFIKITNYPRLVEDVGRVLRPGGLAIFIEPDLTPHASPVAPGIPELIPDQWQTFWGTFRWALSTKGVDPDVPHRLKSIVEGSDRFENIVSRAINIPIGFWPTDADQLTMGQLQWMDYEALLPAARPLFKTAGLMEERVARVISEAQEILYRPNFQNGALRLYTRIYVVYANKRMGS